MRSIVSAMCFLALGGASAINCWLDQHNHINGNMLAMNLASKVLACSKSGISAFPRMRLGLATNN
jgi:hypothetical protein